MSATIRIPATCDMVSDCPNPVTHIGRKGYIYCQQHAFERRIYGTESTRRMAAWEIRVIEAGKALPSYDPISKPAELEAYIATGWLAARTLSYQSQGWNVGNPAGRTFTYIGEGTVYDAIAWAQAQLNPSAPECACAIQPCPVWAEIQSMPEEVAA